LKKVTIFNLKPYNIFIDVDGNKKTDDTIVLGKGGTETISIPKDRVETLKKELDGIAKITVKG